MRQENAWSTIRVNLVDAEILDAWHPDVQFIPSRDRGKRIQPKYAEVTIRDGEVSSVNIKGTQMTKAGQPHKGYSYDGGMIGHYDLEAEIGQIALAELKGELR